MLFYQIRPAAVRADSHNLIMTDLKLVPLAEQLEPGVDILAVRLKAADNVEPAVLRTLYRRHYQIVRVDIAA